MKLEEQISASKQQKSARTGTTAAASSSHHTEDHYEDDPEAQALSERLEDIRNKKDELSRKLSVMRATKPKARAPPKSHRMSIAPLSAQNPPPDVNKRRSMIPSSRSTASSLEPTRPQISLADIASPLMPTKISRPTGREGDDEFLLDNLQSQSLQDEDLESIADITLSLEPEAASLNQETNEMPHTPVEQLLHDPLDTPLSPQHVAGYSDRKQIPATPVANNSRNTPSPSPAPDTPRASQPLITTPQLEQKLPLPSDRLDLIMQKIHTTYASLMGECSSSASASDSMFVFAFRTLTKKLTRRSVINCSPLQMRICRLPLHLQGPQSSRPASSLLHRHLRRRPC